MLWVAPQEKSVNVPASNTNNAIFRRIISDLHARRLGFSEELDATVTKRVAALWKDADLDNPILKEAKAEYAKLQ